MLQTATVESHTFSILKKLMQIPALSSFYLVGGTCLALRYGHRKSVDLDLFSVTDFDIGEKLEAINTAGFKFEARRLNLESKMGAFGFIEGVKIDLIKSHYFKQIDTPEMVDGIRMFGDRDIIAMKIFAILQRAEKKDFWDMAELLQHYTLNHCIEAYKEKYPGNQMLVSIPHVLTYFKDAEESDMPVSFKGQTWSSVKETIGQKVAEYLK
jgi:predicted nucleotidyltransferase component of viral defense system